MLYNIWCNNALQTDALQEVWDELRVAGHFQELFPSPGRKWLGWELRLLRTSINFHFRPEEKELGPIPPSANLCMPLDALANYSCQWCICVFV